jgi:glutathione S-transferase/GST-like protein
MLELYHWEPNLNSGEPIIALKEKGIDFTSHYVDVQKFEQHAPAFLKLNRQGQVPVLVHDGKVITETTLMLLYIEAAFPQPSLMPKRADDRYLVHMWSKYADEYLAPAIAMLGWHQVTYPKIKAQLPAARAGISRLPPERQAVWQLALDDAYTNEMLEQARSRLDVRIKRIEEQLAASRYLAGDSYSLADIMIYPAARSFASVVPDLVTPAKTPRLFEWLDKVGSRPAVRATLAMARTPAPEQVFAPGPEVPRWG